MKPVGLLMKEHRLIERMIGVLDTELSNLRDDGQVNVGLVESGLDFLRTYADRTHHGKEEDILFRELAGMQLNQEHERTMNELISEHVYGRGKVRSLSHDMAGYAQDDSGIEGIRANLESIVTFYPKHIEKEDRHFFLPVMSYLTAEQQGQMIESFYEFDRQMIHARYTELVRSLE